jgi:hypothetical protein
LGIAAFAYYRRVVENRKNEIFDAVRAVASKLNASSEFLSSLEETKKDHRFTESVSHIKPGLPQLLLVQGQNPLTLLHWALSQGIHNEPDDVCLELASSIREVLTELCERMETALKDEAGLKKAVSTLLKYQTPKMMPPGACQKSRCARPRRAPESLLTASALFCAISPCPLRQQRAAILNLRASRTESETRQAAFQMSTRPRKSFVGH